MRWISVKEYAERQNIGIRTVYNQIQRGELKPRMRNGEPVTPLQVKAVGATEAYDNHPDFADYGEASPISALQTKCPVAGLCQHGKNADEGGGWGVCGFPVAVEREGPCRLFKEDPEAMREHNVNRALLGEIFEAEGITLASAEEAGSLASLQEAVEDAIRDEDRTLRVVVRRVEPPSKKRLRRYFSSGDFLAMTEEELASELEDTVPGDGLYQLELAAGIRGIPAKMFPKVEVVLGDLNELAIEEDDEYSDDDEFDEDVEYDDEFDEDDDDFGEDDDWRGSPRIVRGKNGGRR